MKRHGSIIEIKEHRIAEYKKLHAAVWPEVLQMIKKCNIHNYSIYLRQLPDGKYYLFSYFEYSGSDFDGDMAKMAADQKTCEWWDVCKPCHQPFEDRRDDEWWAAAEEVFHCD